MKSKLARFRTYVNASSLAEIVKIKNIRISNGNDVDRGSDCDVKIGKEKLTSRLNLIGC